MAVCSPGFAFPSPLYDSSSLPPWIQWTVPVPSSSSNLCCLPSSVSMKACLCLLAAFSFSYSLCSLSLSTGLSRFTWVTISPLILISLFSLSYAWPPSLSLSQLASLLNIPRPLSRVYSFCRCLSWTLLISSTHWLLLRSVSCLCSVSSSVCY